MAKKTTAQNDKRIMTGPGERQVMAEPKALKGNYCNVANFQHSKHEFVMDFIFHIGTEAHFLSRIITNPPHAKAMLKALQDNVAKYEKKYDPIPKLGGTEVPVTQH